MSDEFDATEQKKTLYQLPDVTAEQLKGVVQALKAPEVDRKLSVFDANPGLWKQDHLDGCFVAKVTNFLGLHDPTIYELIAAAEKHIKHEKAKAA